MNNQKKDFRGMDLRADNFKNQLLMLVNNCNLENVTDNSFGPIIVI